MPLQSGRRKRNGEVSVQECVEKKRGWGENGGVGDLGWGGAAEKHCRLHSLEKFFFGENDLRYFERFPDPAGEWGSP